ncbi:unnamed protein product [Trichogramma brassicae]|uniref:Uncharacterized protein n=1 Tax=Trichogramma brassicae TaxID=86971 RepID=A0A6H5IYP6_9HYME|nr:unnamed protein product [Trichogramma brassicae]
MRRYCGISGVSSRGGGGRGGRDEPLPLLARGATSTHVRTVAASRCAASMSRETGFVITDICAPLHNSV